MSTTILMKTLKNLGADVTYYIPHRENEGYGLNINAVKILKNYETDLIITCDNGIASLEEIAVAKKMGMKVIIIDHHEPAFTELDNKREDIIPEADAVIDPKQNNCKYPFKSMCAAGIVYKFCKELYLYNKKEFDKDRELIIFAMIATFCDIVDLVEENRIIAKNGLDYLNNFPIKNLGLKALIKEKSIENKELSCFDMGFILGPCINATGRLEQASISVELFLTDDIEEAEKLAKRLSELNEERKVMTNESVERVVTSLIENPKDITPIIVYFDEDIHESIAGIVAGRVKDMFYRPTIVLTKGEGCIKGSGRSIEAYNIFENLYNNRELFLRFGGHKMAAGLSLEEGNINILRERLNSSCTLKKEDFTELIYIDKELKIEQITYELATEIKKLEPFGKGNKEPLFISKNLNVEEIRVIEDKNTIIFTFGVKDTYRKIKAVAFGKVEDFKELIYNQFDDYTCDKILKGILRDVKLILDIVYYITINEYNNNISVQLKIKDFKMGV